MVESPESSPTREGRRQITATRPYTRYCRAHEAGQVVAITTVWFLPPSEDRVRPTWRMLGAASGWRPWFAEDAPVVEVLSLEKAATLLLDDGPVTRLTDGLSPRPHQLGADCVGKVFYEPDLHSRRRFRKSIQHNADAWTNAGGKNGRFARLAPARLTGGREDMLLVMRRGHVQSERLGCRFKYVQFSIEEKREPPPTVGAKLPARRLAPSGLPAGGQLFQVLQAVPRKKTKKSPSTSDDDQERFDRTTEKHSAPPSRDHGSPSWDSPESAWEWDEDVCSTARGP